jgi:hypothetical protein
VNFFTIGGLLVIVAVWYWWSNKNKEKKVVSDGKPEVCKGCGNIPQVYFEPKERAMSLRRGEMCCCPGQLFFDDVSLKLTEQQISDIKKFWKVAGISLTQDVEAMCIIFPSVKTRMARMSKLQEEMNDAEDQLE